MSVLELITSLPVEAAFYDRIEGVSTNPIL